jgi:hypothetical protein
MRFLAAIDATQQFSFSERHCPNCLETHHASGVVTYSHHVSVAFLVGDDGFALPLAVEFIENPDNVYNKQDCEKKAFYRLAAKLRRLYPQILFAFLLDALYADQNVMRTCLDFGWTFAITFLPSDMPALWGEYVRLAKLSPGQKRRLYNREGRCIRACQWVNNIDYAGLKVHALEETEWDDQGQHVHTFAYLVGRPVDDDDAFKRAAEGRRRWRCENEGYNVLKNGGFALEHVYSHTPASAKCYFILMLIAHLLQQLITRGRLGAVFKTIYHTYLNYGRKLLSALADVQLPSEFEFPGQIRLHTG